MPISFKFPPGTFLEVDDLYEGRKVVMTCNDGVTYWDSTDTTKCTPVAIHPSQKPKELGTFVSFGQTRSLQAATRKLIDYLRRQNDQRVDSNPLFLMRALVCVASKATGDTGYVPDEKVLEWACSQAQEQETIALKVHQYAEQFVAMSQ